MAILLVPIIDKLAFWLYNSLLRWKVKKSEILTKFFNKSPLKISRKSWLEIAGREKEIEMFIYTYETKSALGPSTFFIIAENPENADRFASAYCEKNHLELNGRDSRVSEVRPGLALSDKWCSHKYFNLK